MNNANTNPVIHEIPTDRITYKTEDYPREKPSSAAIERYADALRTGETLPAIEVYEENGRFCILDGYHRWKAHQEVGYEVIHAVIIDLNGRHPLLYAARRNAKHGVPMSNAEKREVARTVVSENLKTSNKEIAQELGVREQTVGEWVKDLRAKEDEARNATILRLSLLGWTQDEIGSVVGLSDRSVRDILTGENGVSSFASGISQLASAGHSVETIAERTGLPELLVLAHYLKDASDSERMNALKIGIQPYDVWNFSACDPRFGNTHPGRIPGQLIAHTLYFFTEPGDMVIDPMSGSGTTQDVCLAMGRRCYAFDIDGRHERSDVIMHDIANDGWHERIKKANLIFWDAPYFEKMDSSNIGEQGYIEGSISKLSRENYLDFFTVRLQEARELVKKGTRLAFLMSDWDDPSDQREGIFVWDYANIIQSAGWKLLRHIQTPLSTQQVHPDVVKRFRESKRLARLERYLLIAQV